MARTNVRAYCVYSEHLWLHFCFHDEIKDLTRDYRKVEIETKPYIFPSQLQQDAKQLFPDATTDMVVFMEETDPQLSILL